MSGVSEITNAMEEMTSAGESPMIAQRKSGCTSRAEPSGQPSDTSSMNSTPVPSPAGLNDVAPKSPNERQCRIVRSERTDRL